MAIIDISSVYNPAAATPASFQAWITPIHNAFIAFGWIQASDSGQVNVTSASQPGLNSTVYEIWKMADSLQSTFPVFVKVEYGTGATTSLGTLFITVGSGSNGLGFLFNPGARAQLLSASGNSTSYVCTFSGDVSRIAFVLWRASPLPAMIAAYSIERSHDASGGDTAVYVTSLSIGSPGGTLVQQTLWPLALGGAMPIEVYGITSMTANSTALWQTNIAIAPFFPVVGFIDNPLLGAMCLRASDMSNNVSFSINMYGVSHTYLPFTNAVTQFYIAGNQGNWLALRYE